MIVFKTLSLAIALAFISTGDCVSKEDAIPDDDLSLKTCIKILSEDYAISGNDGHENFLKSFSYYTTVNIQRVTNQPFAIELTKHEDHQKLKNLTSDDHNLRRLKSDIKVEFFEAQIAQAEFDFSEEFSPIKHCNTVSNDPDLFNFITSNIDLDFLGLNISEEKDKKEFIELILTSCKGAMAHLHINQLENVDVKNVLRILFQDWTSDLIKDAGTVFEHGFFGAFSGSNLRNIIFENSAEKYFKKFVDYLKNEPKHKNNTSLLTVSHFCKTIGTHIVSEYKFSNGFLKEHAERSTNINNRKKEGDLEGEKTESSFKECDGDDEGEEEEEIKKKKEEKVGEGVKKSEVM